MNKHSEEQTIMEIVTQIINGPEYYPVVDALEWARSFLSETQEYAKMYNDEWVE